jgi:hypothetical protein
LLIVGQCYFLHLEMTLKGRNGQGKVSVKIFMQLKRRQYNIIRSLCFIALIISTS